MKKLLLLSILLLCQFCFSQKIEGTLTGYAGQKIVLKGYNYYKSYELSNTTANSLGNFQLTFPESYKGMGLLQAENGDKMLIVLTETAIEFTGTSMNDGNSLKYLKSDDNKIFLSYLIERNERDAPYFALKHLVTLYESLNELKEQKQFLEITNAEINRIDKRNIDAIQQIESQYLKWFIPVKQLINDSPVSTHKLTERVQGNMEQFRTTNLNDPKFKNCGLFKEFIETHFLLVENMGQQLDSVKVQVNKSIDYVIENLRDNNDLTNDLTENLINYFEKRSMDEHADYLANKMLSQSHCVLNDSLAKSLEKYRVLKVGNLAPDIQLDQNTKLSDIKKPVLLVFGASWCPHCKEGANEMLIKYYHWKKTSDIEVVYISLDTDKEEFTKAFSTAPWKTYCDFKAWDGNSAKKYFVTATPSYLLLDKEMKILVHPKNIDQVDAWVNYRLKEKNY